MDEPIPDWMQGQELQQDAGWQAAMDLLNGFSTKIFKDRQYFAWSGDFDVKYRDNTYRVTSFDLTQTLAIMFLIREGLHSIAAAIRQFDGEEWEWFTMDQMPTRAETKKAEDAKRIKSGY